MRIVLQSLVTHATPDLGDDSDPILDGNPEPFPHLLTSAFPASALASGPVGFAKMLPGDLGPLGLKPPQDQGGYGNAPVPTLLAEGSDVGGHTSLGGCDAPGQFSRLCPPQDVRRAGPRSPRRSRRTSCGTPLPR